MAVIQNLTTAKLWCKIPECSHSFSRVGFFSAPWTIAHETPLSMEFFRQEYWSGLPFPPPGDLPNPGIKPGFPVLQADSLPERRKLTVTA